MKTVSRTATRLAAFLLILGAASPGLPADLNFSALRVATTNTPNDDLLVNWRSNAVYFARRITYANFVGPITNNAVAVINQQYSNNACLYVSQNGFATGIRGRADRPWNSMSNALMQATNGDTVFILPGNYTNNHVGSFKLTYTAAMVSDPIFNRTNFSVVGIGYPMIWYKQTNSGLVIFNSSNVTVRGLRFNSIGSYTTNNTAAMGNSGLLSISHDEMVLVDDCDFVGPHMFGIIEEGQARPSTNNIRVTSCSFDSFGNWIPSIATWDGAGIASGGWIVDNCFFQRCSRGLEMYPSVAGWGGRTRSSVRNCTFRDILFEGITDGGAGAQVQCDIIGNTLFNDTNGVTIGGSNFISFPGSAIAIAAGMNTTVAGNSIFGFGSGMYLGPGGATNIVVTGNTINGLIHPPGHGIRLGSTGKPIKGAIVANNSLGDLPSLDGIFLVAASECTVANNYVGATRVGNGGGRGIRVYDATNCLVTGNTIIDSQGSPTTQYGVSAESSSAANNRIGFNTFRGCQTNVFGTWLAAANLVVTNFISGGVKWIDLSADNTQVNYTNVLTTAGVTNLFTNIVEGAEFVIRAKATNVANTVTLFCYGGTMNWVSTNGTSSATNWYLPAGKIGRLAGKVTFAAGVTNIDLGATVQP